IPLAVTLQGGVGYYQMAEAGNEFTEVHLPVGVGFALTIPNPALAIKPWLAPRVDIVRRTSETGGVVGTVKVSDTDTRFGLSGGRELPAIDGLGVRAGCAFVRAESATPAVFGIGVQYARRLPVP